MSWFNASQLSSFAKQALSQAQKSIDRVLDIQEEEPGAWAQTIPYGDPGISPPVSGGWDTSTWGIKSNAEPQSQPAASPKAITKPVRRTVVDESENFFSAFLSPADVQTIQKSPVVSKPPAKSQRPEEEVKSTLQETVHTGGSRTPETTESKGTDSFPCVSPGENRAVATLSPKTEGEHGETVNKDSDMKVSTTSLKVSESVINVKTTRESASNMSTQSPTAETKDIASEAKEQKHEDRQSNTPSPPVSTFSSGTSTTSDIEVLDHESVISESSASSRQETTDSKSSLHLMQTSFQLLSASACPEYNRLDDFPKLTESCCSSDAFERIDSFSVQSLDSRSVSEINSDDELSGKGYALVPIIVNPSTPKTKVVEPVEGKSEEEVNETVIPTEETEMEESGRSATPVNCEQPDILVSSPPINEGHTVLDKVAEQCEAAGSQPEALSEEEDICKKVAFLNEKLDKREAQLLSLSKEKALLEEAYDNLKDEMFRVKEESSSISSLKDEFAQRIAEAEKKVQLACKERDAAKKEIKTMKEELATRLNCSETSDLLKEKDEQIRGLLEEGEKLSKQQLQSSNIIKKLRAKDKENENIIAKLKKKVKELEEELQHLKQVLDGKEEVEKQHRENIKKLNSVVERQEKDLGQLQVAMNELEEKNRSIQAALDSAYKELTDLHKANAAKASEAQEAALSHEMKAKEELSAALEKVQEEARQQQEALAIQRLQEAENRNQELSQSVSSTTRPLLRQIENLQATLGSQTSSWEKLEKNLSDRLGESQTLLAAAVERERAATEELLANKIQLSSMESQNSLLRQENSRFQAQLESEKNRLIKLEDEKNRYQVELENLKDDYVRTLEETRKEKTLLNSQLEMEKMKVEQERKKAIFTQEAIKEKERKPFSVSSTPTMSRSSSISGVEMAGLQTSFLSQDEPHDLSLGPMSVSASGSNLYEAVRMGAGSSIIENLQSQLQLREGEITHLQVEIGSLEKTRSIMAEELVKLTNQNDELEEKVKEIPKLRTQLRDLDQRYNTILQMYGEKAEEAEELRLDLEDVKNMYKTQIDELLRQRLS
ncbi:TATA element modulatory factor isoform X2 [Myotis myotis]|uniref:TATA element modulatory factor isoform X2 n=1 Tax=Myotis myotis TaxID=51298 RepID=UPI00174CA297|nr:TATA element modulatory factor isoform X2 [Myotis myotis]